MKYSILTITIMFVMGLLVALMVGACSGPNATGENNTSNKNEGKADVAPGSVIGPKAVANASVKGEVTVTATVPTDVGKKSDGTAINAEEIKYELYYARYEYRKGDITVDGGTSNAGIENVAKQAASTANKDVGIVRITGNTALTTGFVISSLLENTIYRYFIRSIHPDDASKYTDTATRLAFVLKPRTVKVIPHGKTRIQSEKYSPKLTHVFIPDSVTRIGVNAFYDNALTSVMIPSSVESIGNWAFSNNALIRVSIPDSVTRIGVNAFYDNALTSVMIGNSVKSIDDGAFSDNKLTRVTIPNSVTEIGQDAFYKNSLRSVTIPNSVERINLRAFANNALTSVIIPDSVVHIGKWAFSNSGSHSQTNKITNVTLSEKLYNKIKTAGDLNTVFGNNVITYQDHTNKRLN